MPALDFATCRSAALAAGAHGRVSSAPPWCLRTAAAVSSTLCGLNCECCAVDIRLPDGQRGFHGTMLRSPRAHVLSQFSHCHAAHHTTWARMASDYPLYLAELILKGTEYACGDTCAMGNSDWQGALEERLAVGSRPAPAAEVGCGHIVVSEIEVQNLLVNLVQSGWTVVRSEKCDRT
jgi:hypothetical protein